ncbi:MAG: replicative DNA helicase, partial [Alphaproteobacteria bacterium]
PFAAPQDGNQPRVPPRNLEAEMALLAALLLNNNALERVSEFLRPEHFADPRHGRIFEAVGRLIDRGQIADALTLKDYFDGDESFAELDGSRYLAALVDNAVSIGGAYDYARTVHDHYLRRELISLGDDMVANAFHLDIETTAADQIEQSETRLYDLGEQGPREGGFLSFDETLTRAISMAESAFQREGQLTGVATGLNDLDRLLGGLHPSDLLILAARPGMGKSALATNIAYNAARAFRQETDEHGDTRHMDGAVVGFFSLEMSSEQLATRILAEVSTVPSEKIRRGEMNHDDFDRVVRASQELSSLPLYIDDTPALTVNQIRTRARRLKRTHGLHMIVVDYLQLIQSGASRRNDGRVQEVSEISRGLKTLAKELDVPVLALSQLSRAVEQREDKRPQLSDLRESGSIEQDADVVMFIYRKEYYLREPQQREDENEGHFIERYERWQTQFQEAQHKAEVIIAKQRHGPTGEVRLYFDGPTTKFDNLAADDRLPDPAF